jgi:hypothetical protein
MWEQEKFQGWGKGGPIDSYHNGSEFCQLTTRAAPSDQGQFFHAQCALRLVDGPLIYGSEYKYLTLA